MKRDIYQPEHEEFRTVVRSFVDRDVLPNAARWQENHIVDRDAYHTAGKLGLIGFNAPEEYGGAGLTDFRYNAIVGEEIARAGSSGPSLKLQNDVITPYLISLGTDEQKQRWLPDFTAGRLIGAMAMSEPDTGSDLAGVKTRAERAGGDWIINGAKTFISCGLNADFVIVLARTLPDARHRGLSLFVVERGMPGFERGRQLRKMGQQAQDTAELFFTDVRVPDKNLLGELDRGFYHLMHNLPAERLSVAINAIALSWITFEETLEYVKNRTAFGQPIGSFQNSRFVLAEIDTELQIAQTFIDRCLRGVIDGELSAVEAAKAKWWCTELQKRVVDSCLQLHGGYGYMMEYPVANAYVDARIQTIYGGSTEIMKEIVGRNLGL